IVNDQGMVNEDQSMFSEDQSMINESQKTFNEKTFNESQETIVGEIDVEKENIEEDGDNYYNEQEMNYCNV
ncbi:7207_t:CDS:2, partial [Racocetra fulgida]